MAAAFSQMPVSAQQLPPGLIPDSSPYQAGKLLVREDFDGNLSGWVPETPPEPRSRIGIVRGKLVIDVAKGATVWLKKPLSGNILITYTQEVVMDHGPNDRLSDLNQFWMATDPRRSNLFTRTGVFSQYDSLRMYYVGFGGNHNTTTRFRKYHGNGQRQILKEYTDAAHLLKPNHPYRIAITVFRGRTEFFVDGEKWFSYQDPHPLLRGYFGFRTTEARQRIDAFRVYRLEAKN
jgi:rhamnogalacturonan endolyase